MPVRQLLEKVVIATNMADTMNSGIRASDNAIRSPAILKKDNYRSWAMKLKAALKVMDCWRLVEGVEEEPPILAPAGATAAERTAIMAAKASWDKRWDRASAVLITSISDEEAHTVYTVDDNPVLIWARLKEKFERKSEAEAETAQMQLLDFAHKEGEDANSTIDRFDAAVKYCTDQGVAVDDNHLRRMFLARPADRYAFLKQSYLLSPAATRPDLTMLKSQLRDIDSEFQKRNSGGKIGGQANQAEGAWGQGTSHGFGRGGGQEGSRGGRGGRSESGRGGGRGGGGRGGLKELVCYCCGQKGHIRPKCPPQVPAGGAPAVNVQGRKA